MQWINEYGHLVGDSRISKVNEFIGIMWSVEYDMLVNVWQHTDDHIEIIPYDHMKRSWTVKVTMSTDMVGFFKRLNDGRIRNLTEDEENLLAVLTR